MVLMSFPTKFPTSTGQISGADWNNLIDYFSGSIGLGVSGSYAKWLSRTTAGASSLLSDTGQTATLSGSLNISGSLIATGNINITGSVTANTFYGIFSGSILDTGSIIIPSGSTLTLQSGSIIPFAMPASYVIFSGSITGVTGPYYAINCLTNNIDYSGNNAAIIINNTINILTSGTIFIRAGTYQISTTITPKNGVNIRGEGKNATILQASVAGQNLFGSSSIINSYKVSDLTFDGNNLSFSGAFAQAMVAIGQGSSNVTFENCKFYNTPWFLLAFTGVPTGTNGVINKVLFCDFDPVSISGPADHFVMVSDYSLIQGCFFDNLSQQRAFQLYECSYSSMIDNRVRFNSTIGVATPFAFTLASTHFCTSRGNKVKGPNITDGAWAHLLEKELDNGANATNPNNNTIDDFQVNTLYGVIKAFNSTDDIFSKISAKNINTAFYLDNGSGTGPMTNLTIGQSQLTSYATAYTVNGNTSTFRIKDVRGYNPIGYKTSTLATSPATYTNNDFAPEAVYFTSGSISTITGSGGFIFPTTGPIMLEPYQSVVVTYTGTSYALRQVY